VGPVALVEEMENPHTFFCGRPEGKRPVGKITQDETIISKEVRREMVRELMTGFV
jgi:hypothetical protein